MSSICAASGPYANPGNSELALAVAGRPYIFKNVPSSGFSSLPERLRACRLDVSSKGRIVRMNLLSDDRLCPDRSVIDLNRRTKIIHRLDELLWRSDWSEARVPRDVASEVELYVHPEGMPWFANTIENILRLLVAFDALNRGAVLLHSAALVRDGRAAVLFGHSGAGKSTTSGIGLEAGCSIVSDDINLLEASNRGWQVRPVPFSGTLNALSDISTPVRVHGLFHLHKSDRHEARPCSTARAVALLAASAPFVNQDPFSTDHLMEIAGDLVRQFGVSELRFARDPGFLNLAFASPEMQP